MSEAAKEKSNSSRERGKLREDLIQSARELLKVPDETFSLKKVAEDADTSTQMIYTLFGGKRQLLGAVYQDQSDKLKEKLLAVEESSPIRAFWKLIDIYRLHYLNNKKLNDTLYSLSVSEDESETLLQRTDVFGIFLEPLEQLREKKLLFEESDLDNLGESLWAAANGVLRFQALGFFEDEQVAKQRYKDTLEDIMRGNSPQPDELSFPDDMELGSN